MIETVNLSEFAPLVQIYAPDAPWPIVNTNLRRAAIEFCERTRCWRQTIPVDVTQQDEAIVVPEYAAIHEIEGARFNGTVDLEPISFGEARGMPYVGQPRFISQQNPNTIRLVPFETGTLNLDVFLKPIEGHAYAVVPGAGYPQDSFDVVPKFLYTGHAETIAAGALYRIMAIPGKPYTSLDMAGMFRARFEAAASAHFAHQIRGQQRARMRTTGQFL